MSHLTRWFGSVWLSPALVGLGLAGLAAIGPVGDGVGLCPYRNMLGVACPGCGLSRAASSMLNGDMSAAIAYHPLVPLFLAQAVVGSVMWVGHKRGWWTVNRRAVAILGVVNIVLLSAVWLVRAANGSLPPV